LLLFSHILPSRMRTSRAPLMCFFFVQYLPRARFHPRVSFFVLLVFPSFVPLGGLGPQFIVLSKRKGQNSWDPRGGVAFRLTLLSLVVPFFIDRSCSPIRESNHVQAFFFRSLCVLALFSPITLLQDQLFPFALFWSKLRSSPSLFCFHPVNVLFPLCNPWNFFTPFP